MDLSQIIRKSNRIVFFFFLTAIISGVYSCRKSDDTVAKDDADKTETFTVVDHYEYTLEDIMGNVMQTTDHPEGYDYHDLYFDMVKNAPGDLFYLIAHDVVTYKSVDDYGNEIELSGLFIYPYRLFGDRVYTPLVSVNHGTELLKKFAPSKWKKDWNINDWSHFAEVIIADLMAVSYGFAIIMPDYQGMGSDIAEPHPYCIKDKLAMSTADMVEYGINTIKNNNHKYITWDGNLFVFGYSEGGFVTMAVTQELEKRNISLAGSVCMEGPYDLSGTMLDIMLGNNPFPVPYFLPLMLVGYHTIYPGIFDYGLMLKEPYNTNIPKYTNGFYSTDVVDSIMPGSKILKEVFTGNFLDSLNSNASQAWKALYGNNTYTGWKPQSKMLLWHVKNDDCVPFGNFEVAKQAFQDAGALDIEYVEYPPVPNWAGTVHESAAPVAFYTGAQWIYNQVK